MDLMVMRTVNREHVFLCLSFFVCGDNCGLINKCG